MNKKSLIYCMSKFIYSKILSTVVCVLTPRSFFTEIRGHHFYPQIVNQNSLIVDLGANKGDFSVEINHSFGCRCYALEASPITFKRIPENPRILKFNLAVCGKNGPITLHISPNSEANTIVSEIKNGGEFAEAVTVDGTMLEDFLANNEINAIDILKMDIEGAEIEVLDSMSDDALRNVRQITVEFHQFCKGFDCLTDIIRIKKRLRRLGFVCMAFDTLNKDFLAINKQKIRLKLWERFQIQQHRRFFEAMEIMRWRLVKDPSN